MKNLLRSYNKLLLIGLVYCSLIVIGACGSGDKEEKEVEIKTTTDQTNDPRKVDTLKTDSAADDKEGATRKIN